MTEKDCIAKVQDWLSAVAVDGSRLGSIQNLCAVLISEAIAAEREACAKLAEKLQDVHYDLDGDLAIRKVIDAIRARK